MRKFPRSERRRPSGLGRAVVVFSRRGTTSSTGVGDNVGGSQTYYVSSVLGGKGDLEIAVVGGIAQPPTMAAGRSLETFSYLMGPVPVMDAAYGWDGNGEVATPFAQKVSEEWFETYPLGIVAEAGMSGGTGWNGNGSISSLYVQQVGEEQFETYALGNITGPGMSDGTGWNGSPVIHAY